MRSPEDGKTRYAHDKAGRETEERNINEDDGENASESIEAMQKKILDYKDKFGLESVTSVLKSKRASENNDVGGGGMESLLLHGYVVISDPLDNNGLEPLFAKACLIIGYKYEACSDHACSCGVTLLYIKKRTQRKSS